MVEERAKNEPHHTSVMGLARATVKSERIRSLLLESQRHLYCIMGELAATPETVDRFRCLGAEHVAWLESQTDALAAEIQLPSEFIVPGDSQPGATLDVARTVVRRAERLVVKLMHDWTGDQPANRALHQPSVVAVVRHGALRGCVGRSGKSDVGADDLNDAACVTLDAGHVEARLGNGARRLAIEVATAVERVPYGIEPVGQRGGQGMLAARVFEEQQRPAGLQHAPDFGQRAGRIRDGAKDKRCHHSLKRARGERQTLRVGLGHGSANSTGPPSSRGKHLPAFVQRKDTHAIAVMRQVDARAGADFQHCPTCVGQQAPP